MDLKECLTNEKIVKKFTSQFELVNYAIKLAENMIISGREPRVKTATQNKSLQVLSEILNNKDKIDDLNTIVEEEVLYIAKAPVIEDFEDEEPVKAPKEKRSRKAVAAKE